MSRAASLNWTIQWGIFFLRWKWWSLNIEPSNFGSQSSKFRRMNRILFPSNWRWVSRSLLRAQERTLPWRINLLSQAGRPSFAVFVYTDVHRWIGSSCWFDSACLSGCQALFSAALYVNNRSFGIFRRRKTEWFWSRNFEWGNSITRHFFWCKNHYIVLWFE